MSSMGSETRSPRQIAYINIAKALAIFLVCYFHFSTTGDIQWSNSMSLHAVIARVLYNVATACVPLFFMCTGALLLNSRAFGHLKNLKRAGSTYVQFVAWAAISILMIGAYRRVLGDISLQDVLGVFLGATNITRGEDTLVALAHLWFIPAYIGVVLLVPFLRTVLADEHDGWISFLALIAVILLSVHTLNTLRIAFPYSAALNAMDEALPSFTPFIPLGGAMVMFAMIGGIAHRYRETIIASIPLYTWFITLAIGITLGFWEWKKMVNGIEPNYDYVFESYTTLSGFFVTISIFMMLLTTVRDTGNPSRFQRICDVIARNTLVIYYVHFVIGSTLQMEVMEHVSLPGNVLVNTIRALLMIGISIAVGLLLRKSRFTRFLAG